MPISTPPLQHESGREGTSGISTGPELTILDLLERKVGPGVVGRICVRGDPVFPGYLLPDGSFDKSSFNTDGWFDTGDLGYMDSDDYLYITGRSKEVINRGGEIISPFEVENAIMTASLSPTSPINGKVSQVMAFSASHDVLQEVVAVVLVTPPAKPRVDLKRLQKALRSSLQQAKWPALIVYMDDLPKKNNKVLRIKFGQRLGLPDLSENIPYLRRHWEAICPAPDTALSMSIECAPCCIDSEAIQQSLNAAVSADVRYHMRRRSTEDMPELFCAPAKRTCPPPSMAFATDLKEHLCGVVHNYMVPETVHLLEEPLPADDGGQVDDDKLQDVVDRLLGESMDKLTDSTEGKVARVLGGDSLRAGRLSSAMRSEFGIQIPINIIFSSGSIQAISAYVDKVAPTSIASGTEDEVVGCTKTNSSTNPFLMATQLIPLVILYPLRRAFQWTIFIVTFSCTQSWPTNTTAPGRLLNLTLSILFSRMVVRIVAPFVGILAKWIIIGRYREGLYPMWGSYHTRWWMVQKIVSVSGKGWFGLNDTTQTWYCKLMGARIGKNVKLAGASLGEWDLLDIRDSAVPESLHMSTICSRRKYINVSRKNHYRRAVFCWNIIHRSGPARKSPQTHALDQTLQVGSCRMRTKKNRHLSQGAVPQPPWLLTILLTTPLRLISWFLSLTPWIGGLLGMVVQKPVIAVPLSYSRSRYPSSLFWMLYLGSPVCSTRQGMVVPFQPGEQI
ncbi:putative secondary metabolism biosynthetic enzyme [Metarhizium acridum]|nr:putative secondary metabolism biosynthetic enzyme [Metarhizium acridum]